MFDNSTMCVFALLSLLHKLQIIVYFPAFVAFFAALFAALFSAIDDVIILVKIILLNH